MWKRGDLMKKFYIVLIVFMTFLLFMIGHISSAMIFDTSKINLNTATKDELMTLPTIGKKLADVIIRSRPIKDFEQLDQIGGIGDKRMNILREKVDF